MESNAMTDALLAIWHFIGSNQVAVLVTVIGSIIGVISIYLAIRKEKPKSLPANVSPFITGKAVTPPHFVGRKKALYSLHDALQKGESISLLGKRRIGKSSLLATWEKSLIQYDYKVVLVNGQGRAGESLIRFLAAICQDQPDHTLSADGAADHLVHWATAQALKHANQKPIILVDECEAIIKQCPHRFWERIRGALDKIIWIFASKEPLDVLYTHYHHQGSPFENQLKTLWLGLLDASSAEKIIAKGDFTAQQQALLRQWSCCHPFYLQSLAGRLWLAKPDTQAEIMTVLDDFKMDSQRHLADLWHSLSSQEQDKLKHYLRTRQAIDHYALRTMGIITQQGQPFAEILVHYLQENQYDTRD